jgi:hypothetical protein
VAQAGSAAGPYPASLRHQGLARSAAQMNRAASPEPVSRAEMQECDMANSDRCLAR